MIKSTINKHSNIIFLMSIIYCFVSCKHKQLNIEVVNEDIIFLFNDFERDVRKYQLNKDWEISDFSIFTSTEGDSIRVRFHPCVWDSENLIGVFSHKNNSIYVFSNDSSYTKFFNVKERGNILLTDINTKDYGNFCSFTKVYYYFNDTFKFASPQKIFNELSFYEKAHLTIDSATYLGKLVYVFGKGENVYFRLPKKIDGCKDTLINRGDIIKKSINDSVVLLIKENDTCNMILHVEED